MAKPFRELHFATLDEFLADLDRLSRGYVAHGKWNLSQICNPCAYFAEGPIKGFDFKVPWFIRVTLGKYLKWKFLREGTMKPGTPTPQKVLPQPDEDEATAVARLRSAMIALWEAPEPWHVSPFFGPTTREEWQKIHLGHASLHLGFLEPRE